MRWLIVLLLTYLTAISFGCRLADREADDQDLGRYSERRIVGGQSTMSREGMNDSMFQEALAEVLKKLDDANECHNFQLVYVKEAKQQVVAGMKYVMTLVVKPIYSGDSSENCRKPCFANVDGNKEVTAEALVQVWKEPKHYISFNYPRSPYTDFNEDGEIIVECSGDPNLLISQTSDMSPEELKTLRFQAAVQHSIDKLNDEAKCFKYSLDRVISGKQHKDTGVIYEWYMKVNRLYDESRPNCLGACADDCSGVETYLVSARVSSQDDEEPQIFKLHRTPV